jgi:hypothetical protein
LSKCDKLEALWALKKSRSSNRRVWPSRVNEEGEEVTFAEDGDGGDVRSLNININGIERGDIE